MADILNPDIPSLDPEGLRAVTVNVSSNWNTTDDVIGGTSSQTVNLYIMWLSTDYVYDFEIASSSEPGETILYGSSFEAVFQNDESNDEGDRSNLDYDIMLGFQPSYTGKYYLYTDAGTYRFFSVTGTEESLYDFGAIADSDDVGTGSSVEMDTSEYLASMGVSMEEALGFIMSNISTPSTIYDVAQDYNVTNDMLAEIVGVTTAQVEGFWDSVGLDGSALG